MNHMRTIGSRKISGTSNSDAYAPQPTAAGATSGSRFQLWLLIRLQLQPAMSGDYLGGRTPRRFAGPPLR